jgi:hypothetical protein
VRAPKRAAPFKGLLFILDYVVLLTSKTMFLSKREFIRNETELLQRLKAFLQTQSASGAHWRIDQGSPKVLHGQSQTDFQATLKIDGQVHHFAVETKLNPSRENVKRLREAAQGQKAKPLLASVHLPDSIVRECQEQGVSCLDLNGRIWVRLPGLLIDRQGIPGQYRLTTTDPDVFSPKSQRLARTLLSRPKHPAWTQPELCEATGLSLGLVSRLLRYCARQGWVEGTRGNWRLADGKSFLDAWAQADIWSRRVTLRQYFHIDPNRSVLARAFNKRYREQYGEKSRLVFTQWIAAEYRHPYAEAPVVSAYCDQFPTEEEAARWHLNPVEQGGRLWLLVPRDEGVFLETQPPLDRPQWNMKLVSDVQIYLDLLQVGLRGPDAAKALREWKGFCQ